MARRILLVGANRGLGLGLAEEFSARGWEVVATAREPGRADRLKATGARVEALDITDPAQVDTLHAALAGGRFDVVFVVAGISGRAQEPIHALSPDEAAHVFLTNAFAPLVFAERFSDLLASPGTMVLMTSVLGSVSANTGGGWEVYRASKAALNTLGRCYAARHPDETVLLMHPGWVRTDMGGENAPLDVATSARGMADVVEARMGQGGHAFVDYQGEEIGW